jgi:ribosomal-protein-alanine N-acetyltransferase
MGMEEIRIEALSSAEDARTCATMMSTSEPWITLGRTYEQSLVLVTDSTREIYVARSGDNVCGFIILNMRGALVGYIQTVCVSPQGRGSGVGTALVRFAETRIFTDHPNVFLCVSSFNPRARALYERLGYEPVGELRDYLVTGHSELLMRKSLAPILEFRAGDSRTG